MIGVSVGATPVRFITLASASDATASYLVGPANRALITSLVGYLSDDTAVEFTLSVAGTPIYAQQNVNPGFLFPLPNGAVVTWDIPVDPGETISVDFSHTGAGQCGCAVSGYLFDAFAL